MPEMTGGWMSVRPSSLFGKRGARLCRSMPLQELSEADGDGFFGPRRYSKNGNVNSRAA
jgi:hypothetical protein